MHGTMTDSSAECQKSTNRPSGKLRLRKIQRSGQRQPLQPLDHNDHEESRWENDDGGMGKADKERRDVGTSAQQGSNKSTERCWRSSWEDEVLAFLVATGAERFWRGFKENEVDMLALPLMTEGELQAMGVDEPAVRARLMTEGKRLAHQHRWQLHNFSDRRKRAALSAIYDAACDSDYPQCQAGRASKFQKQQSVRNYVPDLPGSRELPRAVKGKDEKALLNDPWSDVPEWHKVPGTTFIVDGFSAGRKTECAHWFLTHFHTDHWKGLTKKFNRGTIFCTPETKQLIVDKVGVSPDCILDLHHHITTSIDGVSVTALPANHCPGAAMFLFEVAGRHPLLHTGDFRFDPSMESDPTLNRIRGRAAVVLDTTYASERYAFPSKNEVLDFIGKACDAESTNPNCLFVVGTYSLGKEPVLYHVARRLKSPVYAPQAKANTLRALGFDDVTTTPWRARVHAVPLQRVKFNALSNALQQNREGFTSVAAFAPTGWAYRRGSSRLGYREQRNNVVIYSVPYSEHSAFTELVRFLSFLRPVSVTPSVAKSEHHASQLASKLMAHARSRSG